MCGFAGYIAKNQPDSSQLIERMTQSLLHRGPDGMGHARAGASEIGVARLAIVGGPQGKQPLKGENGSLLGWNGEIYNYRELALPQVKSGSDSVVLHSLLEREGEHCLSRLRGPFALAHLSQDGRTVLLARDEFGQRPLYFHSDGVRLHFGSEMRALFAAGVPRCVDEEALKDYLSLQFYAPGRTLFADVEQVAPGAWVRFEVSAEGIRKTGEGRFRFQDRIDATDLTAEAIAGLLEEACALQSAPEAPAGIMLSGGLDSTVVASALMSQGQGTLQAFVGYPTDTPEMDERHWSRMAAEHCGVSLQEIPVSGAAVAEALPEVVRTLEMPIAGPGSVAQFIVAREASQTCRVVFGGQGGDEVFGGYERMQLLQALEAGQTTASNPLYQPLMDQMQGAGSGVGSYFAAIHRGPQTAAERQATERRFSFLLSKSQAAPRIVDRAVAFEMDVQLPGLLHVDDRVTARFGMEGRNPLLDQRLVSRVRQLPMSVRSPLLAPRDLFRSAFTAHLPRPIANRRDKMGFPLPLDRWLRNELRSLVGDTFSSQRTIESGYVTRSQALRYADLRDVNPREVFGYLMLDLWRRAFLDAPQTEIHTQGAQSIA